ncbi:MAG: O-antigen ligase family protein [Candidatus Moranbacteria bacterium]|nr:O-antigen ligase family protein [Candidatus Moranbacteria bacterium]
MNQLFKKISDQFFQNSTKIYLILANIVLVVFAIWFSNAGLLPFKNSGDFAVFAILSLVLALYRPGWAFALFLGTLALENINLVPGGHIALRPYQFLAIVLIIALLVRFLGKKMPFSWPKLGWIDAAPIVFAIGGFMSALGASSRAVSFKQAIVATSFVALYFLVRIFVQSFDDLKKIAPFFLSSGLVVLAYSIWQNVRFIHGANSFEVMPGRPNGTFTEADWMGIYIVFLLSIVYVIVLYFQRVKSGIKVSILNFKFQILNEFSIIKLLNYLLSIVIFVVLILTVSRSAWVGAAVVVVGFLKFVLYDGSWRISQWQWKKMLLSLGNVVFVLIASLAIVFGFGLTRFQLGNRAVSTGGLQKITIACQGGIDNVVPKNIGSVDELANYGCRHINLEDIEKEKSLGNVVMEVNRPDPNVNIRSEIYKKSIAEIKAHPFWGIGWGSISKILGTDDRGAGLNASNIFLETWLGSGLLGILSWLTLLLYVFVKGVAMFFKKNDETKIVSAFVLLGWTAIVVPNLFNSGIFLGFVWCYIAAAVGLILEKKK